ncbi:MAG: hypothetical protein C4547_16305 [Phycisphaerales bacterium]|nr:MAG: hypothetical protein C4547_16305 [Phycisphaerales bacterium]
MPDRSGTAGRRAAVNRPDAAEVVFDQAIFTSVRTPMGEGYRIIAASAGVSGDEKQAITTHAPSHDALCDESSRAGGIACYPLPSGRLCIATTCRAGTEHTGRGKRIYTYNLVVDEAGFAAFGYSPFAIIRAAETLDLTQPRLKTQEKLPTVTLSVDAGRGAPTAAATDGGAETGWLMCAVWGVILGRRYVVCPPPKEAACAAETVWTALPGPLRLKRSLSVGLKFSVQRCCDLNVLAGAGPVPASTLPEGLELLRPDGVSARSAIGGAGASGRDGFDHAMADSDWMRYVAACWSRGDGATLAKNTAQPFDDCTPRALDRLGGLFLALEECRKAGVARLLAMADEFVDRTARGVEGRIVDDLVAHVGAGLLQWHERAAIDQLRQYWMRVVELWKRSPLACAFAWPLIERTLDRIAGADPPAAASIALSVARLPHDTLPQGAHENLIQRTLERLIAWCDDLPDDRVDEIRLLADQWKNQRPACDVVLRLTSLERLTPQVESRQPRSDRPQGT